MNDLDSGITIFSYKKVAEYFLEQTKFQPRRKKKKKRRKRKKCLFKTRCLPNVSSNLNYSLFLNFWSKPNQTKPQHFSHGKDRLELHFFFRNCFPKGHLRKRKTDVFFIFMFYPKKAALIFPEALL